MKEKLQELGLNKTETDIYLYILSQGRVTPVTISKDTGIKRPTVYAAATELVRRGIISENVGGKTKYYTASPKDLEAIIVTEKQLLLKNEALLQSLLPDLKELSRSAHSPIPRIQYIRESDLEDFFYKQAPVWTQSMIDTQETSWWGYNSKDLTEKKLVRDWIDHYWRTVSKKIELHLFSPNHAGEASMQEKEYDRRYIKYWDEESDASQWIMGDYIVTVVTKQKPQYLIQIKDRLMAESLRRVYRRLWRELE